MGEVDDRATARRGRDEELRRVDFRDQCVANNGICIGWIEYDVEIRPREISV